MLTDSGWNAQVRALSADLGINRHVALLVSDEIEVPITTGVMFPRVVLSLDYPEWSPTRRAAILNHELAHIKRLDAFTQALANVAASALLVSSPCMAHGTGHARGARTCM